MTTNNQDSLLHLLYQGVGQVFSRSPALARLWGSTFNALRFGETPFAAMRTPLDRARIALITTGGVHTVDQQPYDMNDPRGDPTFRAIPADIARDQLTITHDYYDHRDAEKDLNILFPLELFRELEQLQIIGSLATCYSFMGHIKPPYVETLLCTTAPQAAGMLKQDRVDAVLLTPA